MAASHRFLEVDLRKCSDLSDLKLHWFMTWTCALLALKPPKRFGLSAQPKRFADFVTRKLDVQLIPAPALPLQVLKYYMT